MAMLHYAIKILISALVIVIVSEVAKRSNFWAAAFASLPLTSLLAFVWLYLDRRDPMQIANLSQSVFWLVVPSLVLFVALPVLLRIGWSFWPSLLTSCVATVCAYAVMVWVLTRVGIRL
ncbi:MAG: DUF3147 family protein [Dokdonella sp.]